MDFETEKNRSLSIVCDRILVTSACAAPFALGVSLARLRDFGWLPDMSGHIIAAMLLVTIAVFRRKLSFSIKSAAMLFILFFALIQNAWLFGLTFGGVEQLFFIPLFASVFYSTRVSLLGFLIVLAVVAAIGLRFIALPNVPPTDIISQQNALSVWVYTLFSAGLLSGLTVIAVIILKKANSDFIDMLHDREALLKASQNRFQDFAKASSDWFWEMDENLRFTWFSEGSRQLSGVEPAFLIGKRRDEILSSDFDVELWKPHLSDLESQRPFKEFEFHIPYNGTVKWIRISGIPIINAAGAFQGYRGTGRDITKEKEAESASKVHNRLLAQAVEGLEELFALWDKNDRLVVGNRLFRTLNSDIAEHTKLGVKFSEFIRAAYEMGNIPAALGDEEAWIARSIASHKNPKGPFEVIRRDGIILEVHEQRLADGSTITIGLDVTKQRQDENALRKSEERYRELFEQSPVPMIEANWAGVKRELDKLVAGGVVDLEAYLAADAAEVGRLRATINRYGITDTALQLYKTASHENFESYVSREVESGERSADFGRVFSEFHRGTWLVEQEGAEVSCDQEPMRTFSRFFLPPASRESWNRVLISIEDITERRDTEERLRQAQKMEAIGQLTGGIAHDFNNLLAVVLGNAELLEDLEGPGAPLASAIIRASERGAELTQRLLAFSRKQPLRPEVIDLGKLTSDMQEVLQRTLGERIEVTIHHADRLWGAVADLGQVENVVLNLAVNARDAMPNGGELTIECCNIRLENHDSSEGIDLTAGDYVALSVTDHGVGMSPEVQSHAFEPFFTTKEVGKGSGLGLSMVYGFAQQSGGQATINSNEGKGTTVKLYLPRAQSEVEAQNERQVDAVPKGRGETILVIEDDPSVRELAEMMLKNLGYVVLCAEDAHAAQSCIDLHPEIALILSDVVLPGSFSGPEFVEKIRSSHPEIKIIFMSGYPTEAAKRNGFRDYDTVLLNKPFRVAQLAKALKEALEE